MIILDEPYASELLISWAEETHHPVLDNAAARRMAQGRRLALCPQDQAVSRVNAGERLYTGSENSLEWVVRHVDDGSAVRAIGVFKDKARMRGLLKPLDPGFFFTTVAADQLQSLDFKSLSCPFVLKPSVGFCSMGVYTVADEAQWKAALADIGRSAAQWHARYPESVVGTGTFILEGYLGGVEYAIDAYFDARGDARILNILRHDFSSAADTSDRLYCTGESIIRENEGRFTSWLNEVNALVGARDFPVHVEVRVEEGHIRPIEFNPLRFAGLGGTDISWFAFGFRSFEHYLEDRTPDWDRVLAGREGKLYTMSLLNPPAGVPDTAAFDYGALRARFSRVLELRPFDRHKLGALGFLFLETDEHSAGERSYLLDTDLREFFS